MGQVSEKVQAVLDAYCVANGWPVCRTDDDFQETLDQPPVFTETRATRRWWTEAFTVVDLGGTLVGYMNATTTGDDSAGDKGWEFDPATICLVERHDEVKTVTTYRPIVTGEDAGV